MLLACAFVASAARAQGDGWAAVKEIELGSTIYVKSTQHDYKCRFQAASDDVLVCSLTKAPKEGTREVVLPKSQIRKIRAMRGSTGLTIAFELVAMAAGAHSPMSDGILADPRVTAANTRNNGPEPATPLPFLPKKVIFSQK